MITFTGEKPEDISDDVANIKTQEDWTAAYNKANAMNDGDYRNRLIIALDDIKSQFTTNPKTSDQSEFFAGLKTDADYLAKKAQIDSMPDGDLKTNRMARYNELVKLKKENQTILDSNSDQSNFFKGMTTPKEFAAILSVIDSMPDSSLKTNRRKIYEQLVAARDKRELENAETVDISGFIADITTEAQWTAKFNEVTNMTDGGKKTRILTALEGIKDQFITNPKTSDQSEFFAGLKTDADYLAKKAQIDSMPDGDLKTNRMARYNELVKLKKENQTILDSNSDQSNFFKGMTTPKEFAAILSVIDSMPDSSLKTNRRKIYEQLVAARDKRELENAATADISGFIAGITNEDQWTAKYNEASSMEPGIIKTRYLDELMKIKGSVADDIPKPKFMTETLTKQNIPSFLTEIETAIASLRAIPAEQRTLTQSNTLLAYIDRQTLINVTDKAFIAREEEPQLELTDRRATVTIEGTNSDGDNTPFDLYLTQTKNGNWFDANSGKTYGPNEIVKIGPDSDQLDQAGRFGNQLQATLTKPLGDLRTGTTSMSKTALALDAFVKKNPAILTFIGGATSAFMVQLQNELSAIAQALRGRGLSDAQYEEEFINASIAAAENSSVMDNGRIYSQWKALNARHAFSFAKLALESSGQALSNFDYKNAVLINNTGSDYPTYSANIRLQTRIVLQSAADKYDQLLKNPNHNIAMIIPVYRDVWDDTGLSTPLLDYVKDRDPEIIAWANDTAFPVANEPPRVVNPNGNGVGLTEMLNNPVFADSIKVQMERLASEDASESLINGFIQRYGRIAFGDNATAEQLSSLRTALGLGN